MQVELKSQPTKDVLVGPQDNSNKPLASSFGQYPSRQQKERSMSMEGECKIVEYCLLKVNYVKGTLLFLLLAISVVGLLLLKYYKRLRARCFYDEIVLEEIEEATHLYLRSNDKNEEIAALQV